MQTNNIDVEHLNAEENIVIKQDQEYNIFTLLLLYWKHAVLLVFLCIFFVWFLRHNELYYLASVFIPTMGAVVISFGLSLAFISKFRTWLVITLSPKKIVVINSDNEVIENKSEQVLGGYAADGVLRTLLTVVMSTASFFVWSVGMFVLGFSSIGPGPNNFLLLYIWGLGLPVLVFYVLYKTMWASKFKEVKMGPIMYFLICVGVFFLILLFV